MDFMQSKNISTLENTFFSWILSLSKNFGFATNIPHGYWAAVFARSGLATKQGLRPANCVGVIDAGYRGEIMGKFKITTDSVPTVYQPGEAFAQLVIVPVMILEPTLVEELSETERGEQGFGEADEKEAA